MPRKTAEGRKEYQKLYYQRNKERLDAEHQKWRDENPEKHKEINRKASKKYRQSGKMRIIQPDFETSLKNIGDNDK